jgi:hypothetical protein
MDILGYKPPPEEPSALRVEDASKRPRRLRPVLWGLLLTGAIAVATGVTLIGRSPSPSPKPSPTALQASPQPQIRWSAKQLEVILSPEEKASRSVSFISSRNIQNVVLEPVPELAPFVTIQPNTFANVPAGQPQAVTVTYTIPVDATLRDYDGTIHVRLGNETLAQILKVRLGIWGHVRIEEQSYEFRYPPTLTPRTGRASNEIVLSVPGNEGNFPEITLEVFSTEEADPIAIRSSLENYSLTDAAIQPIVIDGIPGTRFSGLAPGLVNGVPWAIVRIVFVRGNQIFVISADNATMQLEEILRTFQFL